MVLHDDDPSPLVISCCIAASASARHEQKSCNNDRRFIDGSQFCRRRARDAPQSLIFVSSAQQMSKIFVSDYFARAKAPSRFGGVFIPRDCAISREPDRSATNHLRANPPASTGDIVSPDWFHEGE
jgi:hypothetical protein